MRKRIGTSIRLMEENSEFRSGCGWFEVALGHPCDDIE